MTELVIKITECTFHFASDSFVEMMNDAELFVSERLKTSMCATQYFNAKELPEIPELCVDTVISWAMQSSSPPLSVLAQRFLRTVLTLSSYEVRDFMKHLESCGFLEFRTFTRSNFMD